MARSRWATAAAGPGRRSPRNSCDGNSCDAGRPRLSPSSCKPVRIAVRGDKEETMTLKHNIRNVGLGLIAVFALIAAPSVATAQDRGTVQGVVNDASGRPVTGAFVKLKHDERRL